MSFITDKQTLDDLNIPGKYRADSVFSLFNKVFTRGGERLLCDMFQKPLSDHKQINERSKIFQDFISHSFKFPFIKEQFQVMEEYLSGQGQGNLFSAGVLVYWQKIQALAVNDEGYGELHHQLITTLQLLNVFRDFLKTVDNISHNLFIQQLQDTSSFLDSERLRWLDKVRNKKQLTTSEVIRYDHQLRTVLVIEMKALLEIIYPLDVYIAVSSVARKKKFSVATAIPQQSNILQVNNLRHPCLERAIGNAISVSADDNVVFLTGANMAGKSTFMKSFGIAFYLAHMGFPVAAENMIFSVKDGLYTSINVPDNLDMGYSHFYAEVLRVKHVAIEITKPLDLLIIFDELFKGTNVKDAYDATLSVTEAFAEKRDCFFIISTHITEAGEELRQRCDNLQFLYFPSLLQGNSPVYTYKLEEGISNDKHGMMIIRKEGILELIEG